ncbi:MAG: sarcosine oxidase subunit gamma [Proteobacteria bacterium]|nr:sarcosine oxidase subunit gamma [Pseudomonadota bacterium]
MAEATHKRSPLADLAAGLAGASVPGRVSLAEEPFLAQIDLRGDAADGGFREAAGGVIGAALPLAPNTVAQGGRLRALWLGPDEWLIVGPEGSEGGIEAGLKAALAGRHVSIVDVSASRTAIAVAGAGAREVLAKGMGLDLHSRAFGPGRSAQAQLARAQVILEQVSGEPRFRLFVRASFAPYLARWLIDATAEYRIAGP